MKEKLEELADKIEEHDDKLWYSFNDGVHVTCQSEEICDKFKDIILEEDKIVLFNGECYSMTIPKSKWDLTSITKTN